MIDFLSFPLLGWWWTGHQQITKDAVAIAVSLLASRGVLRRIEMAASHLKAYLSGLWLMNVCQDIDLGNALGKCGIEVPGGQVAHFMRDQGQSPHLAYKLARSRIHKSSVESWRFFKLAFPMALPSGWKGTVQKVASVLAHAVPLLGAAEAAANLNAQKHLARALHCLQDSFSPAHTRRMKPHVPSMDSAYTTMAIWDIYAWDNANKNPNPGSGWPGHDAYDKPTYMESKTYFLPPAIRASAELIACVIGHAQGSLKGFELALDHLLNDLLRKNL